MYHRDGAATMNPSDDIGGPSALAIVGGGVGLFADAVNSAPWFTGILITMIAGLPALWAYLAKRGDQRIRRMEIELEIARANAGKTTVVDASATPKA